MIKAILPAHSAWPLMFPTARLALLKQGGAIMDRTVVDIPVVSEGIRRAGVPLSPVIKANGFVFVSGLPPIDLKTGRLATGDIATQTSCRSMP